MVYVASIDMHFVIPIADSVQWKRRADIVVAITTNKGSTLHCAVVLTKVPNEIRWCFESEQLLALLYLELLLLLRLTGIG